MCAWSVTRLEPRPTPAAAHGFTAVGRREALQWAAALFVGGSLLRFSPAYAAGDEFAFAAGSLEDVLSALGGQPASAPEITLAVPDLVENGALVPVQVSSLLPGPQAIYIVSESNPYPLVARFSIPDGTDAFVATRIKVAASCNVYAVIKSGERLYWAAKHTQVTIGGCGG
jgi:sulfur-oxidizing protein SoxY